MGRSWRSLSPDQRQRFVPVFSSFLEDAYLNKVQNYSGQEIQITKAYVTDKDYAQVSGGIVQQGSEPIGLGFSLKREGGVWKIYDVAVDNVSTLDSYRTEFQRIMGEEGFDELMTQIQRRDRELASTRVALRACPSRANAAIASPVGCATAAHVRPRLKIGGGPGRCPAARANLSENDRIVLRTHNRR